MGWWKNFAVLLFLSPLLTTPVSGQDFESPAPGIPHQSVPGSPAQAASDRAAQAANDARARACRSAALAAEQTALRLKDDAGFKTAHSQFLACEGSSSSAQTGATTPHYHTCDLGACRPGQTVIVNSHGATGCASSSDLDAYLKAGLSCMFDTAKTCAGQTAFETRGICRDLPADGAPYVVLSHENGAFAISPMGGSISYWVIPMDIGPQQ